MGTQKQDLRDAVEVILEHGWTEHTRNGYRKFRCPCGRHRKTVRLSPSDPNYVKNLMGWFRRQSCWEEGDR